MRQMWREHCSRSIPECHIQVAEYLILRLPFTIAYSAASPELNYLVNIGIVREEWIVWIMRMVSWPSICIIAEVSTLQECYWSFISICGIDAHRHNSQFFNAVTVLLVKDEISESVHRHQSAHIAPSLEYIATLCAVFNPFHHFHHEAAAPASRIPCISQCRQVL